MESDWTCGNCGEAVEEGFDRCWSCGAWRSGEVDPQFPSTAEPEGEPAAAGALCPDCLTENDPQEHFCVRCAKPLSSHAASIPLGQVYAAGSTYQKAAERPRNRMVFVGTWLIFGPQLVPLVLAAWQLAGHLLSGRPAPGRGRVSALSVPAEGAEFATPAVSAEPGGSAPLALLALAVVLGLMVLYGAILWKVTRRYRAGRGEDG